MFNGVGWGEVVVLLLIGLFVFGPDRLPKAARDAGRMLRQLRQMANGMRNDLRSELGPEFADLDIRDLHPKTFVRKHLFEDEPPLPPYLTKRVSLDSLLLGDDTPESPSLTKDSLVKDTMVKGSSAGREAARPASDGLTTPPTSSGGHSAGNSSPSHTPSLSKPSSLPRASSAKSLPAQATPGVSDPADLTASPAPFDPDAT